MRKYVVGFLCGVLLTAGTTVFASSSVQAVISPIKYVIHGKQVKPEGDNVTLNYKGRVYVPIRFVAENSGDIVAYDEKSTVTIDDQFNIFQEEFYGRIGYLKVTKSGTGSIVSGKVFVSQDNLRNVPYTGILGFFDREGKWLGEASFTSDVFSTHGDQIRNIHAQSPIDLSEFKAVVLIYSNYEIYEVPHAPPSFDLDAKSGDVAISLTAHWKKYPTINGFTRVDVRVAIGVIGTYDLSGTLTFYDADGRELATAPVEGRVGGKVAAADYWKHEENIQDKILMAKGDIAGWKSVKLTVHSLQKVE